MKIKVIRCEKNITVCRADSHNNTFERSYKKTKYACDPESASVANMLVENTEDSLCLEISGGAALHFDEDCVIAVTGAPSHVSVGGEILPHNCAAQLDSGDTLEIAAGIGGYLYIAVNGSFEEVRILGKGDEVEVTENNENLYNMDLRVCNDISFDRETPLRLVPGPYAEDFGEHALEILYTTEFTVKSADRTYVTFHGIGIERCEKLPHLTYAPVGALFIDDNGDPYILMQDSEDLTDKKFMATVISTDMSRLASLAAGDRIRFSPCTVEEAQRLMTLKRKEYIRNYLLINTYEQ